MAYRGKGMTGRVDGAENGDYAKVTTFTGDVQDGVVRPLWSGPRWPAYLLGLPAIALTTAAEPEAPTTTGTRAAWKSPLEREAEAIQRILAANQRTSRVKQPKRITTYLGRIVGIVIRVASRVVRPARSA